MITHTHRPLRVVLYEGQGAIPLPAEARAKVMAALLDKGYAVTRTVIGFPSHADPGYPVSSFTAPCGGSSSKLKSCV